MQRVAREVTAAIDALIASGELRAEVTLACPQGVDPRELQLRHIRVRKVGRMDGMAWEQLELSRFAHDLPLLCLGNSAPLWSLVSGRPVGVLIHDLSYIDHPAAYRLLYRTLHRAVLPVLLSTARSILLVSHTERRRILALMPKVADRVTVSANGGWTERATATRPVFAADLPDGYIFHVGSLSHRKNFHRTLAAAVRLAREDGIPFVFAGSTAHVLRRPEYHVPDDVAHLIHFIGQVECSAELGALYEGARLLLFPSLYEASPLPPYEAAHFGCPVVASNIASMWERCGDGVFYCDPLSVDSIVATTRSALSSPDACARKVASLRQRIALHGWKDQARDIAASMLALAKTRAPEAAALAVSKNVVVSTLTP